MNSPIKRNLFETNDYLFQKQPTTSPITLYEKPSSLFELQQKHDLSMQLLQPIIEFVDFDFQDAEFCNYYLTKMGNIYGSNTKMRQLLNHLSIAISVCKLYSIADNDQIHNKMLHFKQMLERKIIFIALLSY